MDWSKICLLVISIATLTKSAPHNHFVHRIHVPQKIKTIFHTKIIKVPEHHHYFHEKEKIVPEHHHYIHEKEKLVKYEPHKTDEFGYLKNDEGLDKTEEDEPFYPPYKHQEEDYSQVGALESKRVVHRKRPPQRKAKHHKRKFH